MFKKLNKKGFTLAELLVVVAIIGVLVAISIPIFTSQLEKSRDAVTLANLRSAYAMAQAEYLTANGVADEDTQNGQTIKYTPAAAGSPDGSVTVSGVVSKGTAEGLNGLEELSWLTSEERTALAADDSLGGNAKSWTITFTYTNGLISAVTAA